MNYKPELLPIGLASFKTMIEGNFIYVDKTQQIYDLVKLNRYYFLSRPRRFGKSLLISTLEQLFLGNKSLFEPFAIAKTDYKWPEHPVINLCFSSMSSKTVMDLENDINWTLEDCAQRYGVDVSDAPSIQTKFKALIKRLSARAKVVILVDEYDYPLLNNVHDLGVAEACRVVLHNFFTVLKDLGDFIRLIFITGVTKFSKTSIFSGLNNLDDLSLSRRGALLLGYTQEELLYYFEPYLKQLSNIYGRSTQKILEDICIWYDGYQFIEEEPFDKPDFFRVYNPFSVLFYLQEGKFLNYWFDSGTPRFLIYLIKTQGYTISQIEGSEVNADETKAYEIEKIQLIPLLWQTGYLTIDSYDPETKNYKLKFPNQEVKVSFLHYFMSYITETKISFLANYTVKLNHALKQNDLPLFFQTLEVFFANIPYTMQLSLEKYYQSIFYVILNLIGAYVKAEEPTNDGRIDAVVETASHVYLLEFKLDEPAEVALQQIKDKKYYQKYLHIPKKIVLIGVAFDTQKRNIRTWIAEEFTLDDKNISL